MKIARLTRLILRRCAFCALTFFGASLPSLFAQDTLSVYTYDSFVSDWGPGPVLKKSFEAECDCTLNLVGLSDGAEILTKIRLEKNNPKADVALGLDSNLTAEAAQSGLFTQHKVYTGALRTPIAWNDDFFLPYDYGWFAFVYKKSVLANPPGSFADLIAAKNGSIIIQDPRLSTPGLGLMLWVKQLYAEQAAKKWQELSPKILTVTKGWSDAYNLFLKGEADMVLSYTTSPSYHRLAEETDDYAALLFEEGNYLQVEVAGILASTQQPELAQRFLKFLISHKAQEVLPTTQWMLPVSETPLPAGFDEGIYPKKSVYLDPAVVAKNRKAWTAEWKNSLSQ